jgi:hypothetical protein
MLTLHVPPGIGTSHIYDIRGNVYRSHISDEGSVVIDVPPAVFHALLADRQNGSLWHNSNAEALRVLGTMSRI